MLPPAIYDPVKKLELLSQYIAELVDRYPQKQRSFDAWMHEKYPELCFGTVYYYREIATNCFYCRKEFNDDQTIDHFFPRSVKEKNKYKGIFVICCKRCNNVKGDEDPERFMHKMIAANMRGQMLRHFTTREISKIAKNVALIQTDHLYSTMKRVYYFTRSEKKLPKDFIRIHYNDKNVARL